MKMGSLRIRDSMDGGSVVYTGRVTMRGLIIDYAGVLEGPTADAESWKLLLSELRMNGIGIAILSNSDSFDVPADLARWKETDYVDEIVLSSEIGVEKPDFEAFYAAARALGEDHKDCVCVDDSIEDVHAAVQAGLIAVLHTAYERTEAQLRPLFNLH